MHLMEWLRKNNKKLLAVFGVFLMIAFIVPTVSKNSLGRGDVTSGYIGDEAIDAIDLNNAIAKWEALQRMGLPQQMLGVQTARLDGLSFLLLLREARKMGVQPQSEYVDFLMQQTAQAPVPQEVRELAIADFATVIEAFTRIAGAMKFNQPQILHALAMDREQVSLKLVEFKADDFKDRVTTEPTPEQLEAFFNEHKSRLPDSSEDGVGYRYPDRVKVEYLWVPQDAVKHTITDEDIYAYWKQNREQFKYPETQPSTQPSTQPADLAAAPATQPSTQPVYKPWREVAEEIRDTLAAERTALIADQVNKAFLVDWPAFSQVVKAMGGIPTGDNAPPTSVGVPYASDDYLKKVADRVASSSEARGVLPQAAAPGRLFGPRQLQQLPGIGKASRGQAGFAAYAIGLAEPLLTAAQRREYSQQQVQTMALYQPSPILKDDKGNLYVFRVVAADKAHDPATLAEVKDELIRDYKTEQAMKLALEAAKKFLQEAQRASLDQAATVGPTTRPVIATESFTQSLFDPMTGRPRTLASYKIDEESMPKFVEGAFELLRTRLSTGNAHPVGLIELHRSDRVVVAQLLDAKPLIEHDSLMLEGRLLVELRLKQQIVRELAADWFNPKAIRERMQFRPPAGTRADDESA